MFTKKITDGDVFTSMPPTTQCLYFHLCMGADDDGFSNNIRIAMFNSHATTDDFNTLVNKRFIIPFESGVIVIKHWKMHNYIQSDRYHETKFLEEKSQIVLKENGVYTECIQNGYKMDTEVSIGKDSIDKVSIGKDILSEKSDNNTTLSDDIKDIIDYLNLKNESNYRPNTTKTRTLIKSRLKEGFTVDDFKTVIDKKVSQWKSDTKMSAYLRPETLFGTKFEGYLNEKIVENNNQTRDLFKELRDC